MSKNKYYRQKVKEVYGADKMRMKILDKVNIKESYNYKYQYVLGVIGLFVIVLFGISNGNNNNLSVNIKGLDYVPENLLYKKIRKDEMLLAKSSDGIFLYDEIFGLELSDKYNVYIDDILYNQVYLYKDNDMEIEIGISDEYVPVTSYLIDNIEINDMNDIIIYENKDSYLTSFKFKNVYYSIKTINIEEKMLLDLITTIMSMEEKE